MDLRSRSFKHSSILGLSTRSVYQIGSRSIVCGERSILSATQKRPTAFRFVTGRRREHIQLSYLVQLPSFLLYQGTVRILTACCTILLCLEDLAAPLRGDNYEAPAPRYMIIKVSAS